MGGFPSMKIKTFQSSQASKFHLQNFEDNHVMFFDRYWSHIQDFQELIRRILMMFRSLSFPKFSICWSSEILRFQQWFGTWSWFIWRRLVSPKFKIIGFGSRGHNQKSEKHANDGGLGFFQDWIEKVLVRNEAESFYGAFGSHFSEILR